MSTALQMTCSTSDPLAAAGGVELIQAFVCTYANSMSVVGLGLVAWFTVSAMAYVRTGSVVMPVVLMLLIGSAALTQLPSVGLGVAAIVLVGSGATIAVLAARRLDRA
jgi:hypothetical protein